MKIFSKKKKIQKEFRKKLNLYKNIVIKEKNQKIF